MMCKVEQHSLNINGFEIEYKSSGSGFPLVLIHTYHPYAKYFLNSLPPREKYQVMTVNIPGYYSTGQKKPVDTLDKFIDLLDSLFTQLGLEKVDLLGECLGSVIVLKYAAKYPQRVRKLVVVSLPLRIFDPKVKRTIGPLFFFLRKYKLAGSFFKTLIRINLWRKVTNYLGGYQGFWDLFRQETQLVSRWNFDARVFWGTLANLFEIDIENQMAQIKAETLFVIGEKDKVTKRKEIMKFCQEHKNASYASIPKANHSLVSKNTRQFNQLVTKFLLK